MSRDDEFGDGPGSGENPGSADAGGATNGDPTAGGPEHPDIDDLLNKLDALEATVDDDHERRKVRQTIAMVERMPGSKAFTSRISKYTGRDMAESFVGAVIFSLPLLVEDGVFEIAEWFVATTVGPVPLFLTLNVAFVVAVTAGVLYYADFRDVRVHNPFFGVIPRRLVAVLLISLVVAFSTMFLWGRLHEGSPTTSEAFGRVTVIWAAAAFGASLGDILPGESEGRGLGERLGGLGDSFRDD